MMFTTICCFVLLLLAVLFQHHFSNAAAVTSLHIFRLDNGDFCLNNRCKIEQRHCMIGLQFIKEEEITPRCMVLPDKAYPVEATENVLFEPTPKQVHLFSRGGDDNTTMLPLYFWETMTPFGTFNAKYLKGEYPGKLFRVLTEKDELFLVRVPGRDRELISTATTTTTTTATTTTTTTFHRITTTMTIAPPTITTATSSSSSSSVLTTSSSNGSSSSSSSSSITPPTTVLFTTTTHVDVRRRASSVGTLETIPPLVGLSFCVAVLLVLYVRRVWLPAAGCCCATCIHRWLLERQRRHRRRIVINSQQGSFNDNIELTSLEKRGATSSSSDFTNNAEDNTNTSSLSFVNVSLEED